MAAAALSLRAVWALRTSGLGRSPAGLRAFWGGRRKEEKEEEEKDAAAEKAVRDREEPVPLCPAPRSRSYRPSPDLQNRLESLVREILGPSVPKDWRQAPLEDKELKYRLLSRLAAELGHAVPNSRLHLMRCAGDVLGFYSAPVKDMGKLDELTAAELPPNLRIVWKQ